MNRIRHTGRQENSNIHLLWVFFQNKSKIQTTKIIPHQYDFLLSWKRFMKCVIGCLSSLQISPSCVHVYIDFSFYSRLIAVGIQESLHISFPQYYCSQHRKVTTEDAPFVEFFFVHFVAHTTSPFQLTTTLNSPIQLIILNHKLFVILHLNKR